MNAAEQYVAAAYLVVFVLVLTYVLIIATKLQRLERTLQELSVEANADESAREVAASERRRDNVAEAQMR